MLLRPAVNFYCQAIFYTGLAIQRFLIRWLADCMKDAAWQQPPPPPPSNTWLDNGWQEAAAATQPSTSSHSWWSAPQDPGPGAATSSSQPTLLEVSNRLCLIEAQLDRLEESIAQLTRMISNFQASQNA
jgi:hypothetical protein